MVTELILRLQKKRTSSPKVNRKSYNKIAKDWLALRYCIYMGKNLLIVATLTLFVATLQKM